MSLYDLFYNSATNYLQNNAIITYYTGTHIFTIKYFEVIVESQKVSKYLKESCVDGNYVAVSLMNTCLFPSIILGIMHLNKAFIYLDLTINKEHISNDLKPLGVHWLVVENMDGNTPVFLLEHGVLRKRFTVHLVTIELWEIITSINEEKWKNHTSIEMAYAIKTSGTTGESKLIQVPHRCIVPNIQDLRGRLNLQPNDVIFQAAPLTFDPSIVDIFLALSSGAALLVVSNEVRLSHTRLSESLFPCTATPYLGVTVMQVTPSFLSWWPIETLQNIMFQPKSTLRALILGGEPPPHWDILMEWKGGNVDCKLFNIYGITEVSCWASLHEVDLCRDKSFVDKYRLENVNPIPLGTALSGTLLSVRDTLGVEVQEGEGEMFIGSMDRVCLINEELMANLELPLYRATGDIVKVDSQSGQLFYVGRKDRMVKRHGHRVSLYLVEQVANKCPGVGQCHCVWDSESGTLGLLLGSKVKCLEPAIQQYLVKSLPPAAIPDIITRIPVWPITNNGKIDYQKLRQIMLCKVRDNEEPHFKDDAVDTFHKLWSKYLGLSKLQQQDTFVQHGGTSFIALQLLAEMEKITDQAVSPELIPKLLGGSSLRECCECLVSSSHSLNYAHQGNSSRHSSLNLGAVVPSQINVDTVTKDSENSCSNSTENIKFTLVKNTSPLRLKKNIPEQYNCVLGSQGENPKLDIRWKFDLRKCVDSSPAIAQYTRGRGVTVIGSHSHKLVSLDNETGTLINLTELPDRIESSVCIIPSGHAGIVGCYNGSVYCVHLSLGDVLWEFPTRGMVKSSPTLCREGSAVVVGSYDQSLYCLTVQFPTRGMVKSSPTLCREGSAVVVGSYDQSLYCLTVQDGTMLWSVKPGEGSIFSSPCASSITHMVFVGTLDGTCAALSELDGSLVWASQLETPVFSSPALLSADTQVLFVEVAGTLHCFSVLDGTKIWNMNIAGNIFSSPCVVSATVDNGLKEMILLGCHNKSIYCLHEDGDKIAIKWTKELDSPIFSTSCTSSFINCVNVEDKQENLSPSSSKKASVYAVVATTEGTCLFTKVFISIPAYREVYDYVAERLNGLSVTIMLDWLADNRDIGLDETRIDKKWFNEGTSTYFQVGNGVKRHPMCNQKLNYFVSKWRITTRFLWNAKLQVNFLKIMVTNF
uniref:Carrier domain-containing protein n=1 Tax=Timema bartmani TaxID=61472 RepID=A0A7R9EZS7_9NEOP|nr:unnamed protein product [Timema bartmani]